MSEPIIDVWRFRLFCWQSWTDIWRLREMNWIDIEWIRLHMEMAPYKQSLEMNVSLVGFNLSIDWFYGTFHKEDES